MSSLGGRWCLWLLGCQCLKLTTLGCAERFGVVKKALDIGGGALIKKNQLRGENYYAYGIVHSEKQRYIWENPKRLDSHKSTHTRTRKTRCPHTRKESDPS